MRETTYKEPSTKQPCLYFETKNQTNSSELRSGNKSRNMIVCVLHQVKRKSNDPPKNKNETKPCARYERKAKQKDKYRIETKKRREEKLSKVLRPQMNSKMSSLFVLDVFFFSGAFFF